MSNNSLLDIMEHLDDIQKIVTTLQTLKAKITEDENFVKTQEVKIEKLQKNVEGLLKEKSTRIKEIANGKERFEFCD